MFDCIDQFIVGILYADDMSFALFKLVEMLKFFGANVGTHDSVVRRDFDNANIVDLIPIFSEATGKSCCRNL
ncbi:hypothetical protein ASF29_22110 [Rhizobium sp. Leaf262]|nr:hypothetical protein ASF29_22110 [Rhizobium sp. Leaf262]